MTSSLGRMAVTRLEIKPGHHLLEIGCGSGTTVAEVAHRLTTGSVLAIDRSSVTRATTYNADHIKRGVVQIVKTDLSQLRARAQSFDTVYALNVDISYDPGAVEIIRRLLRRKGRLVLGYRRPVPAQLAAKVEQLQATLAAGELPATVDWVDSMHVFLLATKVS